MCRIGVFPPKFPMKIAVESMGKMKDNQKDGCGFMWRNKDNKIAICKSPDEWDKCKDTVQKQMLELDNSGTWVAAHLRAASCGKSSAENSHPFLYGDGELGVLHNGSYYKHDFVRDLLIDTGVLDEADFKGSTDSEVCGHMIHLMGVPKFNKYNLRDGVFVALSPTGINIIKSGAWLYRVETEWGPVFTTEELYKKSKEQFDGYVEFDYKAELVKAVRDEYTSSYSSNFPSDHSHTPSSIRYHQGGSTAESSHTVGLFDRRSAAGEPRKIRYFSTEHIITNDEKRLPLRDGDKYLYKETTRDRVFYIYGSYKEIDRPYIIIEDKDDEPRVVYLAEREIFQFYRECILNNKDKDAKEWREYLVTQEYKPILTASEAEAWEGC